MILTCPNCGTQYVVKDGAIPAQGRQVRCASCKHSWYQNPEPIADDGAPPAAAEQPQPTDEAPPAPPPAAETPVQRPAMSEEPEDQGEPEQESIAQATLIEPRSGPAAEERAFEEAVISGAAPNEADGQSATFSAEDLQEGPKEQPAFAPPPGNPQFDISPPAGRRAALLGEHEAEPFPPAGGVDDFSPFAERERDEPRGRSPIVTISLLVLVIAVLAAAFWYLAPSQWKARVGLADGRTPLQLMITHPDRQPLASGNELLTVTGRVINPTASTQVIPPMYAQLKSRSGKLIYSWTIAPPAPSLGPGASASFNSAEVNVPPGGEDLTISLGAPKA